MQNLCSKEDFINLHADHDWFYEFSDSSSVYDRGYANFQELVKISKTNEDLSKLFELYMKWKYKQKNGLYFVFKIEGEYVIMRERSNEYAEYSLNHSPLFSGTKKECEFFID